jgi:molybdopterin-containing oxidoreductase family membrane subunit
MDAPKDEVTEEPQIPSLEAIREGVARSKKKIWTSDIDLAMPDTWLNQYSLSPMFYTTKGYFIFVLALSSVVAWGLANWGYQIFLGMGVTNLNHPVFWGLYISTFVFWVGLSHSGTIVSSLLRLSKANWRRPILRGAEVMTAFSLLVAGLFPLIHVGRIWRVYYMFPLPNQRELWPNFQSPLTWDMTAIGVYLTGSMIFLFVGLLPDIALARDLCPRGNWRKTYLTFLSLGWRGTHRQWEVYEKASTLLAVIILLIAPSVHTIVSWDFAMSIVPGWHTAIFGPYFVVGAIYSGIAGVITLMVVLRWVFGLDEIIRKSHLNNLSKLLLVIALIWSYFYFTEFFSAWYVKKPIEWRVWLYQGSHYPYHLIIMLVGSAFAITMLCFHKVRTNPFLLLIVTLVINVGMFIERYLIVVPALSHKDNPFIWTHYIPSSVEIAIVVGSAAYFVLLYAVFVKLLPVVTVADIREGNLISGDLRVGNALVRVQAQLEE